MLGLGEVGKLHHGSQVRGTSIGVSVHHIGHVDQCFSTPQITALTMLDSELRFPSTLNHATCKLLHIQMNKDYEIVHACRVGCCQLRS